MAKKRLYRKVIRFEILSETPFSESLSLEMINEECMDGSWSGQFLDDQVTNQIVVGKNAVKRVNAQGSEASFFNMDEDGNDLDYL